jgi:Flp pilus assembly protein TadD
MNKRLHIGLVAVIAVLGSSLKAQTPEQAIALEKEGNLGGAAEVWKALTERNPYDAALFAQLGVTLLKQHRYSEAASSFRKANSIDPRLTGV